METEQLDNAIDDLEVRLERLRSLYEQYFLGIEKIEPSVARKDVDRRIWQLRREKIRNTARRFRLQQIVQRYNTFQQYWQRICREIENGTYRRHLLRAERALGTPPMTIAARRRSGQARSSRPPASDVVSQTEAELGALLDSQVDSLAQAPGEAHPAAEPYRQPAFSTLDLDLEDEALTRPPPAMTAVQNPLAALGRRSSHPAAPARPSQPGPRLRPPAKPGRVARSASSPERIGAKVSQGRGFPPAVGESKPGLSAAVPPLSSAAARDSAARKRAASPTGATSAGVGGLSPRRLEELHSELMRVKRQNRESGKVSLRNLEKSLRAAEARLRERHKHRKVDFQVVIKDGKTVVKPILR